VIALSVQLDRAGSPHDHHRLIDVNDRPYRMFLRAKLRALHELNEIDLDRQKDG
jgi:hypothetical protein